MQRDIRELFKNEKTQYSKQLPDNHRAEFLEKLQQQPKKTSANYQWIKIAAVLLIALTIGFGWFNRESKPEIETQAPIIAQIEAVEAEYLRDIETEWNNFIAIAEDEVLVTRFKKKLDELDVDYQEISAQFKQDANNLLVIESLIENLQTRLQILKDIQQHIKILNQKNGHNENII